MKKTNLLIVEDQQIFAEGLQAILQNKDYIGEIDFALTFEQCLDQLKWKKHDLIILDINFDRQYDGVDIAKKIKELYPTLKILILTQRVKLEHYQPLMKEIKVDGYLDKKLGKEEIFLAIETVLKGEIYLDKRIESKMQIREMMRLKETEIKIIELLGEGFSQKKIAATINLHIKTIEYHISKLVLKTQSNNAVELVKKYNDYKLGNREKTSWE